MAKYSNVVRFRVKQECIAAFEKAYRDARCLMECSVNY